MPTPAKASLPRIKRCRRAPRQQSERLVPMRTGWRPWAAAGRQACRRRPAAQAQRCLCEWGHSSRFKQPSQLTYTRTNIGVEEGRYRMVLVAMLWGRAGIDEHAEGCLRLSIAYTCPAQADSAKGQAAA